MPFPRNVDFVGRSDDLERLHAVLQSRQPVGIRPAGLTGMGGIGKTQLAVEYVYRCKERNDYPGGIFWVNAAEPLAQGLAQVGAKLRPETLDQSPNHQLRAAFDALAGRPDALIVFDNLEEPALLTRSVGLEGSPATLGLPHPLHRRDVACWAAFTPSRSPSCPRSLRCYYYSVMSHGARSATILTIRNGSRPDPSAVSSVGSPSPSSSPVPSLAEWPDTSLADYRKRLESKGCLTTLDRDAADLAAVNFQPIHDAAVAATLMTQWDALNAGDEAARLLLRVAGQFAEADRRSLQ